MGDELAKEAFTHVIDQLKMTDRRPTEVGINNWKDLHLFDIVLNCENSTPILMMFDSEILAFKVGDLDVRNDVFASFVLRNTLKKIKFVADVVINRFIPRDELSPPPSDMVSCMNALLQRGMPEDVAVMSKTYVKSLYDESQVCTREQWFGIVDSMVTFGHVFYFIMRACGKEGMINLATD